MTSRGVVVALRTATAPRYPPAMLPSARLSWLLALAACAPGRPSAPPSVAPPARPAVRSCPVDGGPRAVDLDPRIHLGEAGGVTWLYGHVGGEAALARLDAAGGLATTGVPLREVQAGALDGDQIWLYAPRAAGEAASRWLAVDVRDPDAPVVGPVAPLQVGARLDEAAAFAVGPRHAVLVAGALDDRELILLDRRTRAAVAPPHPLGPGFAPVHASCGADGCAVVAVTDEGGGPARRLVVVRVRADGTRDQEPLAPAWVGRPHAAAAGDRVVVVWPDAGGVSLRALDRDGRPVGPAVPVSKDSPSGPATLLAADGRVVLALAGRAGWSVAALGPDAAPGPLRAVPGAPHSFLLGAPLVDGLAWVNVGGDVHLDMIHTWRSEVVAGFLPADGAAPTHRSLASAGGPGRGGLDPQLLVRPGAAAVLLSPRGDALGEFRGQLAPLRAPCP